MAIVLEINNLSYQDFENIKLSFEDKMFYSIIGANNCGKTTLFKLISGIIPSNSVFCCDDIDLNEENMFQYIIKLGVLERETRESFVYKKVLDEMMYPLRNLDYSYNDSLLRIKEVLNMFDVNYFLDKNINELNYYEKELLLLMISLLHKPKVLLIDSVLEIFPKNIFDKIIIVLRKLISKGLTVINFTNSLNDAYYGDKIILLDKKKIVGEYSPRDIFNNDQLFYEHNLEIPFLVDLSIKLKMYNLVDKEYLDMKEMVDDIWP